MHYMRAKRHGTLHQYPRTRINVFRFCRIETCSRGHYAKGFCELHYRRWRTGKAMLTPLYAKPKKEKS